MGVASGGVGRWTRRFAVASAAGLLAVETGFLLGLGRLSIALVATFGFVLPMIFGMGYLLLPSYAGRTLRDQRLPGVHFALALAGAAGIVGFGVAGSGVAALRVGVACWSAGVAIFVGTVAWTVVPALLERPAVVLRSPDLPQRSTRLATAAIPVAVAYLLVGTVALLGRAGLLPPVLPTALSRVLHYHLAGFAALLIYALGARLLTGFFHVAPPRRATWVVLVTGSVAPALLATRLWGGPLFGLGAALEALALLGYAVLVATVAVRSAWDRVGLYGVATGAGLGALGALAGLGIAFRAPTIALLRAHASLQIGFLALTIVGYAYEFFPVASGRFAGATEQSAVATIVLLGSGSLLRAGGVLADLPPVRVLGSLLGVVGALGYVYLLGRRLRSTDG